MKLLSKNNADTIGIDKPWFYIKLSLIITWIPLMVIMITQSKNCPYPVGICKLIDLEILFSTTGKTFLFILLCISFFLYVFEIKMVYTTLFIFVLSCIIISYHESNGFFFRATPYSAVFGSQFIAYAINKYNPDFNVLKYRIHFGIQIIAASYTLAAIAKLKGDGIGWIDNGGLFSIQVMKNYSYLYYDTGSFAFLENGKAIAYSIIEHKSQIKYLLATALGLELLCFVAILNSKVMFIYGLALLAMHIGFDFFMGIGIGVISKPMVVLFLNPLFLFHEFVKSIYLKLSQKSI